MRIPIRSKLIATYLLIALFTALTIYLLIYFTSEQRIKALAKEYQQQEMISEIHNWYVAEKSWDGFGEYFKELHPPPSKNQINPPPSDNEDRMSKVHGILDKDRRALLKYLDFKVGDVVPEAYLSNATEIKYKDQIIGWVIPPDAVGISLKSELEVFLENANEILIIAIGVSIFCALIMGMVLAKFLLKPIESLTQASQQIADGQLYQKVSGHSDDEVGDLTRAFNQMSHDLAIADQQRKQLTADITHDLGTPIQVISGYVEMAQEGALELNKTRLDTIAKELDHINRLIKDMGLLAETDSQTLTLNKAPTGIKLVVNRVSRLFEQKCSENSVAITTTFGKVLPDLELDEERIVQVLTNLVSNAIRYTPKRGTIQLSAHCIDNRVKITVSDSGSGIAPEDLPFVFDRFYRAESARSGKSGKMGLGLAISKGLVEIQEGDISIVSPGILGGADFIISFPCQNGEG